MECKEALEAIHAVLDGEAPQEVANRLREHLQHCRACARHYESLLHWDDVLRAADADEPDKAYFETAARAISSEVRTRARQPVPTFVLAWRFSAAVAAACLLMGLGLGHFAFPRTITKTRTVVQRVPGPVREVEKVVVKKVPVRIEVPVEVVRWRTRTVTVVKRVPVAPLAESAMTTEEAPDVSTAGAEPTPTDTRLTTLPAVPSTRRAMVSHRVSHVAARELPLEGAGALGLTRHDLRALAKRLSEDMGKLDEAINAPRLAAVLASDIGVADAEIEKAISGDTADTETQ